MKGKIRVIVADDHTMVRRGLIALLERAGEFSVVGEPASGRETVTMNKRLRPDVAIVDIALPDMSGIDVARSLRSDPAAAKTLILSSWDRADYVRQAVRAGAAGFLLKTDPPELLISAARALAAGEHYFSPAIDKRLLEEAASGGRRRGSGELTPRESEVLCLIAQGHSNRGIAGEMGISPRTVAVHRMNLMKKLAVHNAGSLLRLAREQGLIPPEL